MYKIENLISKFRQILPEGRILQNEEMKRHTTFKIGGAADIMLLPSDKDEVCKCVAVCRETGADSIVIGNGSNLLVSDKGYRGVVIKLGKNFSKISYSEDECTVSAQAGALLSSVASFALSKSLTGLEFASGIPGSIGGAVFMNAGAYGGEMKDIVTETEYLGTDGEIHKTADCGFAYRKSIFQENGSVILGTKLKLKKGSMSDITEKTEQLAVKRREKQPLNFPSAGSAFKRPEGYFAAKLIDDAGLRGFRTGGAAVSEKHTGFIVNCGGASAEDVKRLMEHVRDTVYEKFGVTLQSEIRFIGEGL